MPLPLARLIVGLLAAYVAAGLLFALPYVTRGIDRIDPSARGSSWRFRVLLVPGVVALWPYLAVRWMRGAR